MKGDFTRFSHRPQRYYAGVLMQQGRVTLDADWNEQFDIDDHRWRVQTIDTIGRACAPAGDAGFEISFTPDGSDLIIGEGRIYIDGLLVENRHGTWVRVIEIADERLDLADMAPDGVPFEEGEWIEVAWDDPEAGERSTTGRITGVDDTSVEADFFEPPDATLENLRARRLITYLTQPFYRATADPPFADPLTPGDWEGRRHLVYLDVWRRHVTAIEDPPIREVALGGPDTATRVQTAWAVRILFDGDEPFDGSGIGCDDRLELWDELVAPKAGRMSARAEAGPDPEDPCEIRPEAGYRGLENRLYRVEIHDPGPLGTATYKWSGDNGSILASITGFPDNDEIQVHSLGKDRVLRFGAAHPVEVFSDETEMSSLPGTLTAVSGQPDEAERIITLEDDVSVYQSHHTPRARRWDGGPTTTLDAFVELEKGVQVRFSGGPFDSGDYWVIPARVATGEVDGFIDAPPRGCFHHLARLSLITWSDDVGDVDAPESFATTDCRRTFDPLCGLQTGREGCATVTVGDGVTSVGDFTSIQAAVDAVPAEGPAQISILPGEYVLDEPVRVTRARLTIAGCDDQTRVRSTRGPAFELDRCSEMRLEGLRVVAADAAGTVLVTSSAEVTLQRCTVINGRPRADEDLTNLAVANGRSTLETRIDPGGPAVVVNASTLMWILDNRLLGNPAVSVQASLARCAGNTMRLGGVWIRDGSRWVTVARNELLGGLGAGVALGGLAPGERPSSRSTGVRQVDVSHNRIASMFQAGVSTVAGVPPRDDVEVVTVPFERFTSLVVEETVSRLRGDLAGQPAALVRADIVGLDDLRLRPVAALGDVEEVVIASNLITGCGRQDPDPFFDDQATGGIVLRDTVGTRILDNEIVDNGRRRRAAGIFLAGCESTDISGNRIRGNGSDAGLHADLTAGRTTQGPNPVVVGEIEFELEEADQSVRMPLFGLLVHDGLRVTPPDPVGEVCFTYFSAEQVDLVARSEDGNSVVEQVLESGVHTVSVEPGFDFAVLELRPRGEGSDDQLAVMSLVQFCAGPGCQRYQGGIVGIDLTGADAGPAIALHGNEVDSTAGQALLLTGVGRKLVADNRLVSRGPTVQSCALAESIGERPIVLLPKTVLVYNAGQSASLGNRNLAAGGGLASRGPGASGTGTGSLGGGFLFERTAGETDAVLVDSLVAQPEQRDPEGPVVFHGNEVSYRPAGGDFVPASVTIVSFDDVAVSDNRFEAEAPGGMILVDVFVGGMTVRAADNALREPPRNAALSGRLSGLLAHVTGNQATHCIAVIGSLDEVTDNQILMEQMLPDYRCERLGESVGIVSAFSMATGGG